MLPTQLKPRSKHRQPQSLRLSILALTYLGLSLLAPQVLAATDIVKWEFASDTTTSTDVNGGAIASYNGSGTETLSDSWQFDNWRTDTKKNTYFQFQVDLTGYSGINFAFYGQTSDTNGLTFQVRYSTNGGKTFTKIGTDTVLTSSSSLYNIAVEPEANSNSAVYFRLYGYNATDSNVTWNIDNVVISGTAMTCPSIAYVDDSATTGNDNGFSWKHAFTDLQKALDLLPTNGGSCTSLNKIWVAEGTYNPSKPAADQTATFQLINGVEILGGFAGLAGSEGLYLDTDKFYVGNILTTVRDVSNHVTTLSGDIGTASNSDNSYHVVTVGSGISATLDGVTITGGNANGTGTNENGGGLYNDGGSPKLVKVTFSSNTASNDGGGLYNNGCSGLTISGGSFTGNTATNDGGGMYNLNCSPTISNSTNTVTFSNNTATNGNGGGMYNNGSSPQISRIFFQGNSAPDSDTNGDGDGAGIYNTNSSDPYIHHAIFDSNNASGNGGGIYSNGTGSGIAPIISQTTFYNNSATNGGAMYNDNSKWEIHNSILWNNSTEISDTNGSATTVQYSIVEGGWTGTGNKDADPLFQSDFQLGVGSPAIDAGSDSLVQQLSNNQGSSKDLNRKDRIVSVYGNSSDAVDMGPYETQFPITFTITCDTPSNCDNSNVPHNDTSFTFQVTFNEGVKGVEANDFILTVTEGSITILGDSSNTTISATGTDTVALDALDTPAGYSIVPDNSSNTYNTIYTVTINLDDTSEGKLRLDVVDDDGITNEYDIPLGNTGDNTGDFEDGDEYYIDTKPPTITIEQASTQTDPTTNPTINFTVTFSEPVTDFTNTDVNISGTAQGTLTATITPVDPPNDGTTYNVAVSDMTTSGTVTIDIPANKVTDAVGNDNLAFDIDTPPNTNDNEVTYNNFPVVSSITRDGSTPTNASSVTYTVTFSQDVTGVDQDDFDIVMTDLTDATITSVTQGTTSDIYTITVDTGNGNGSLQLNLADDNSITNGDSVQLESANDLDGSFDGEIYTIDKTAPTVEITEVTPDPRETPVDTITIVFSEEVIDFTVDDIELNASSLSSSGATLNTSDDITWTLSGLTSLTSNDGSYTLTVKAAGITDNAGNVVTADDTETWTKGTNTTPTLVNNTGLTLDQGTSATITNTQLQTTDHEQNATALTYTIGTVPANGTLKLDGTPLSNGDTFTQDDIDNELLTYEHDNSSNLSDSFTFTVSDGAGGSITDTTFSITITATATNTSPSLDTNGLTLEQGASATITNTQLQTTDNEQNATELTYTIGTVPANGTLKLDGTSLSNGDTFTQDDIDKELLTYEHNDSSTTSDSFTFTVTDGSGGTIDSTIFDITINPVSNPTPPNAPTDLTATAVSQTQIDLSWIDNSDDETGFKITRGGTLIETTAANVKTYSDTGLTCNTTYTYQVTAYNDNGDSTTIEATATTHACDEEEEEEENNSSSGGGTTPLPSKLSLTIKFAGKGSGSVQSEPSGIDCNNTNDSCSYAFSAATDVTLTPTAADGSEFSSWSGASDCGDGELGMTSNISCTVYFQLLPATLAVTYEGNGTVNSSPNGIDCGDTCTNTFDGDTEVILTATPDDGWMLDSWTGDCNSSGRVTIDSGKKCHAIFVEQSEDASQETEVSLTPPYLTVTKTGEGTITSEPAAIDCGEDCTQEYTAPGTQVTLIATPDNGWAFDQWQGDCDDNGQITITEQGNQCEAIFVQTTVPFVLNVAITGQGSVTSDPTGIDCGDTCRYDYQSGLSIALTATPDNAWEFEGWRGHCDETGKVVLDGEFNFKQCRAVFVEASIVAEAGLESKALALEITGNGTVTSQPTGIDCGNDCLEDYTNDTEVTLTPMPDIDWRFEGWAGDCDSEGYVFVNSKKSCEAIFVEANAEPFTLNIAITGEGSVTSEPTGIDCGTICSKDYATGLEVALNATPDNGWEFEGWRGHCDEAGYVTLDGEFNFKQCRAVFVEAIKIEDSEDSSEETTTDTSESKPPALEVTKIGFGTVTSQPRGIDCGNDCFEDYDNDIEVTLTPTPENDWRFEGWAGDCDSNGTVFVDTEKQCEAIFVDANAEPFTLNIAITGEGSVTSEPTGIDCGATCAKDYATGLEIALNASPDNGWEFEGWRGHCDETGYVTLDGDFNFKQCRAVFVESSKADALNSNEESDDSQTDSDSSTDDHSETGSDLSTDGDSETGSDLSSHDDSGTNSDSSTNDSETDLGSSTNTSGNSQIGTSSANFAIENNPNGITNSIENVGPNSGDGNNDGILDSQQNNVLSLQNANGEYVTVEEKNGCTINPNGNNLEFDCLQADVDNYYYGVSEPSEVPECQEPQVTCQIITIQGQPVVVTSSTLNDGDANDSVPNDGKITQPLAPGQSVVQETNVSTQSASGNSTASGNAISSGNAATSSTTSLIEVFENNLQSIDIVIEVGETVNLTIGGIDGIFFIKEMPDSALVAADEAAFVSSNGELTLTGLAVGDTQMILSDQLSSQEVTLYITVLPPVTLEEQITASKDIGLKTRLTTLKIDQIITLIIADGQGMLSIIEPPDDELISLSDWVAYGDGTAEVTLKGIQAGSTQLVVKDSATPPQQTALNILVIGKPAIGSQAITEPGPAVNELETPTTGSALPSNAETETITAGTLIAVTETEPTTQIEISLDDSPCEPINSLGIDAVGNPVDSSNACFVNRISLNGVLQANTRQLTRREAKILRVSTRIQVASEHVAQPAEILLLGVYSPSKNKPTFYTRDNQTWFVWDEQISSLITAQEHPVLPEIVDVFIFEGDLSILPGEFTVYVGYRLLEDGAIIYNGFEPIHFFVDNQ
jgi:hypothetical protein